MIIKRLSIQLNVINVSRDKQMAAILTHEQSQSSIHKFIRNRRWQSLVFLM